MLTSTRSEHVARLRRLHERKGRLRSGSFLAEGPDCVTAALEAGLGIEVVEVVGVEDHPLMDRVLDLGIPFHAATQRVVAAIGDAATPQGIIAQCTLPTTTADSVVARRGSIVVCDRISDPGNLGTIIRTAEAVGAAGVATTEGSVDAWNPKVVRASAGSIFRLPVVTGLDEHGVIDVLAHGRTPIALHGAAQVDVVAAVTSGADSGISRDDWVWIVGSEAHGVSTELLQAVEWTARIPMAASVESLNAAISVAIALYAGDGVI